ncbi:MAG TPA: quinone-dependent dihydroorotate dehydrogenase [Planctomycetota bacterium]|nr:quinone-dependent dihydroorotate dehydrogenase [Planctomycetota bacterium]
MTRRGGAYRSIILPVLSRLEPERAHRAALRCLALAQSAPAGLALLRKFAAPDDPRLHVRRFGATFAHPVGVAAGLDKDGEAVAALLAIGFASVEVGTVTPRPQPGNPPPRVWRLRDEAALINRLGFPSIGAAAVRRRLRAGAFPGVIGVNVSANRDTPPSRAPGDCAAALAQVASVADYAVLNVSSPNTPGLRNLQRRDALVDILEAMKAARADIPLLVKLSPDMNDRELDEALSGLLEGGGEGVVVSNTTTGGGRGGGLSGPPLRARANALARKIFRRCGPSLPIIGVGGISSVEDVVERMKSGACLVQLYTAFVYEGPGLPGRLARGLSEILEREGVKRIEDLVGVEA